MKDKLTSTEEYRKDYAAAIDKAYRQEAVLVCAIGFLAFIGLILIGII